MGTATIARSGASPREQAHESNLRREDVEVRGRQISVDVQVAEGVVLFASLAFKLQVQRHPADAVRTLAVNQVLATYFFKCAVPMLQNGFHRVGVFGLRQRNKLYFTLKRHLLVF